MAKSQLDEKGSSRRSFLKRITAASFAAMQPTLVNDAKSLPPPLTTNQGQSNTVPTRAQPNKRFIAIQVGAVSFVGEGVERVLDLLQEKAHINALLLAVFTYGRGIAG